MKKKLINLTMFDLLKGIAMLGVLLGHSMHFDDSAIGITWFGKILHSLLMPAFFMVSGYWLKKRTIKVAIKNSAEYLLLPYLVVVLIINLIGFVHRALLGNLEEWGKEFLLPSVLVSTMGETRIGPLWFVIALFWAWCLYGFLIHIKSEKWQVILAILSATLGCVLLHFKLPFQIGQGLIAFFYVYCGYLLKKKKLLEKKIKWPVYLIMAIVWWGSVVFGSMDLYLYDVKYGLFSVIGSLCGAFLLIKAFLYVNLLECRVLDGIGWIGRYSMWFVCLHAIENAVFPWKILFRVVEQQSMLGTMLQFCLRTFMIVIGCLIMQRIQMYWMGRKNKE